MTLSAQTVTVSVSPGPAVGVGTYLTISGTVSGFTYGSSGGIDVTVRITENSTGINLLNNYTISGLYNGANWSVNVSAWMTGRFTVHATAVCSGQSDADSAPLDIVGMNTLTGPVITTTNLLTSFTCQTVPAGFEYMALFSGDGINWYATGPNISLTFNAIGLKSITATCGANSLTHHYYVAAFTLLSPSGEANQNPADPNRFVFTSVQPGSFTLDLWAEIAPAAAADFVGNNAVFTVQDITGSTRTWAATSPNGQATRTGCTTFGATCDYTGLPEENNQFGKKYATIRFCGVENDRKYFWVFYPADYANYPGAPEPDREPEYWQPDPPNYFYYYKQTSAYFTDGSGNPGYYYGGSVQERPCWIEGVTHRKGQSIAHPEGPWNCWVESRQSRTGKYVPTPGSNANKWVSYIDIFAWACRHEVRHIMNYKSWYTDRNRAWELDLDRDQDFIPDDIEAGIAHNGIPYNPENPCTHDIYKGLAEGDDQLYTCMSEEEWIVGYAIDEDWAHPGSHWP